MTSLGGWGDVAASLISLAGAVLFFASGLGIWRLPDLLTRLHAPTKAATLGLVLLSAGSLVGSLGADGALWLEDLLIMVFVAFTVPLGAQVLARAAVRRGVVAEDESPPEDRPEGS